MQNIPFASSDSGTAADCMGRWVTGKATELCVRRCYPDTRSDLRGCMFWLACLFSLGFTKHRIRRWEEVRVSSSRLQSPGGTGQAFNSLELGEMENPDSLTDQQLLFYPSFPFLQVLNPFSQSQPRKWRKIMMISTAEKKIHPHELVPSNSNLNNATMIFS